MQQPEQPGGQPPEQVEADAVIEHEEAGTRTEAGEEEVRPSQRIYVASLSDYNAGRLHGAWIDAAQSAEELHAEVQTMLRASPEPGAEEFAIHDYEGFGPFNVGEYTSLDTVAQVAAGIAEHGLAFAAWADEVGAEEADEEGFLSTYLGEWASREEFVEEEILSAYGWDRLLEDAIPEALQPYVELDVEGFARDMEIEGAITVVRKPDGGVWIFDGLL
jgi:antirestriction protein